MAAFDGSAEMVAIARRRLGEDVPVTVADLDAPLPFADDEFDDVVASLVLHYLEDWGGPLAELRRVLKPGGRLILSVNHPLVRVFTHPDEDYFATRSYSDEFEFGGEKATLTFWHRPLHAMTHAFTAAGFDIAVVDEPAPSPDSPEELLTPRIRRGETTSFLAFIFFVLEARGPSASPTRPPVRAIRCLPPPVRSVRRRGTIAIHRGLRRASSGARATSRPQPSASSRGCARSTRSSAASPRSKSPKTSRSSARAGSARARAARARRTTATPFGDGVVEIPETRSSDAEALAAAVARTNAALASDADVVYQAAFATDEFVGFADFLRARRGTARWVVQDTQARPHAPGSPRSCSWRHTSISSIGSASRAPTGSSCSSATARRRRTPRETSCRSSGCAASACAPSSPTAASTTARRARRSPGATSAATSASSRAGAARRATPRSSPHRDLLLVAGMRPVQRERLRAAGIDDDRRARRRARGARRA